MTTEIAHKAVTTSRETTQETMSPSQKAMVARYICSRGSSSSGDSSSLNSSNLIHHIAIENNLAAHISDFKKDCIFHRHVISIMDHQLLKRRKSLSILDKSLDSPLIKLLEPVPACCLDGLQDLDDFITPQSTVVKV